MGIAMLVMLVTVFGLVCGAGLVGFLLGRHQLRPLTIPPEDRRLAEQDERIELLEDELRRVREQADFTERLLTERGDVISKTRPEGTRQTKLSQLDVERAPHLPPRRSLGPAASDLRPSGVSRFCCAASPRTST